MRNAFVHPYLRIDGGYVGEEDLGDAVTILDQVELAPHGVLSYAGHSLDLREQVIPALVATRKFIYDAIAETGTTKTYNSTIELGPFGNE